MYKHLSHLPFYAVPQQIMALTLDQIRLCTTGTLSAGTQVGSISLNHTLAGTMVTGGAPLNNLMDAFVDPETSPSSLVQNLVSLPAVVRSYQQQSSSGDVQPVAAPGEVGVIS